jgi:hypothetical protein
MIDRKSQLEGQTDDRICKPLGLLGGIRRVYHLKDGDVRCAGFVHRSIPDQIQSSVQGQVETPGQMVHHSLRDTIAPLFIFGRPFILDGPARLCDQHQTFDITFIRSLLGLQHHSGRMGDGSLTFGMLCSCAVIDRAVAPYPDRSLRVDREQSIDGSILARPCRTGLRQVFIGESEEINLTQDLIYGTPRCGHKTGPVSGSSFRPQLHTSWETKVNQSLERILGDHSLGLAATARIILLYLAQSPSGARIEDIARYTGSGYRWIEKQVSKLTRVGILRRVGRNTYAINTDRELPK